MTPDPTLPTTREELERKVLDFVTDLAHAHELGELDPVVAAAQSKAAWSITAGLIDNELSAMLAEYSDQIGPEPVKVFFVGTGKVLMLVYLPRGTGYALFSVDAATGARTLLKKASTEPGERAAELHTLSKTLIAKGFARQ